MPSPTETTQIVKRNLLGEIKTIDERVVTSTDAFVALSGSIPANSVVERVRINNDTALSYTTATNFGVGISGDPDAFGEFGTTTTQNTKEEAMGRDMPGSTHIVTATTPRVSSTNGSGAAAGDMTGTVHVVIEYRELFEPELADA